MSELLDGGFGTYTLRCFPYFISTITTQDELERVARIFFETTEGLGVDPFEATMIFQSYKMFVPEDLNLSFSVIDSIERPFDMYHIAALDKRIPGQRVNCRTYIKNENSSVLTPPGLSNAATCLMCPFAKKRYKNAYVDAEHRLVRYMLHSRSSNYYSRIVGWAFSGRRLLKFRSCVDLLEGLKVPYPAVVPLLAECVKAFERETSVYSEGFGVVQQFEVVEGTIIKALEKGSLKQAFAPLSSLGLSAHDVLKASYERLAQTVASVELPSYEEAGELMSLLNGDSKADSAVVGGEKASRFVSVSLGEGDAFNVSDCDVPPDLSSSVAPSVSGGQSSEDLSEDEPEIAMPEEPVGASSDVPGSTSSVVDENDPFPEDNSVSGGDVSGEALAENSGLATAPSEDTSTPVQTSYTVFTVPNRDMTGLYCPTLLSGNLTIAPYPSDEAARSRIVENIRHRRILPLEVVPDEDDLPVLVIYDKTDDVFYRIDGGDLGYGLMHVLSGKSVTKICYQPYLFCSYSRFFKIKSRNIYPLYSSDSITRSVVAKKGLQGQLSEYASAWYELAPAGDLEHVDDSFIASMRGYVRLWALQKKLCLGMPRALEDNEYLDVALGYSYMRSCNFNDDSVLFRISDKGKFEYNPNVVMSVKNTGAIFTYTVRQFGAPVNSKLFLLGLIEFAKEGRFRSYDIQVLSFEPSAGIIQIYTDYYYSDKFENDYIGFLREYACSHLMRGVTFSVNIKRMFATSEERSSVKSILPTTLLETVSMTDDRLLTVGADRVEVASGVSMGAKKPSGATQNEAIE